MLRHAIIHSKLRRAQLGQFLLLFLFRRRSSGGFAFLRHAVGFHFAESVGHVYITRAESRCTRQSSCSRKSRSLGPRCDTRKCSYGVRSQSARARTLKSARSSEEARKTGGEHIETHPPVVCKRETSQKKSIISSLPSFFFSPVKSNPQSSFSPKIRNVERSPQRLLSALSSLTFLHLA